MHEALSHSRHPGTSGRKSGNWATLPKVAGVVIDGLSDDVGIASWSIFFKAERYSQLSCAARTDLVSFLNSSLVLVLRSQTLSGKRGGERGGRESGKVLYIELSQRLVWGATNQIASLWNYMYIVCGGVSDCEWTRYYCARVFILCSQSDMPPQTKDAIWLYSTLPDSLPPLPPSLFPWERVWLRETNN